MDPKIPQYQRAVTPTLEANTNNHVVKGKVLSYNTNLIRGSRSGAPDKLYGSITAIGAPVSSRGGTLSPRGQPQELPVSHIKLSQSGKGVTNASTSSRYQGAEISGNAEGLAPAFSVLPRYDLVPVSEDLPSDGIIFAKTKTTPEILVVFRTPEERLRNPERLNLDRRQLEVCPLLEQEQRLRLLNFQNNSIRLIQNLENLPNLIFLDLYNNKITSLEGPLSTVRGLRVLMVGKNKITAISNLQPLRKLDVLDLHSNDIRAIEGLDGLSDLRVLNLAGNRISMVKNLSSLASLTELNLRRNNIDCVTGLNQLPALQRVFLSHNAIRAVDDVRCLFEVNYLIELSLDGNPLSEGDPAGYRAQLILGMPGLRHLDLKRITEEERTAAAAGAVGATDASQERLEGPTEISLAGEGAGRPPRAGHMQVVSTSVQDRYHSGHQTSGGYSSDEASVGAEDLHSNGISGKSYLERNCASESLNGFGASDKSSGERPGSVSGDRRGIQKYINQPAESAALPGKEKESTSTSMDSQTRAIGDSSVPKGAGLAALARAGKLFNTHSIFELEVIGPDEKALIAVGDNWEWTPTKRLLLNVTEASLYHMKRQCILNKFGSNQIAAMPALKCLRLVFNDFDTLKSVEFIPQLFGKQLEQLIVKNTPLVASTSSELLRAYFIAMMPRLRAFNEEEISMKEREAAVKRFAPFLSMALHGLSDANVSLQQQKQPPSQVAPSSNAFQAGSLLRAHHAQTVGATVRRSGSPRHISGVESTTSPPLLAAAHSMVGSGTVDFLRQHPQLGSVWSTAGTAAWSAALLSGTGPHRGGVGFIPNGLSHRALGRHALQAEFTVAFDSALRRIVGESISEAR